MAKRTEPDMMKVVVCRAGKKAAVEDIGTSLEAMQKVVGGYIERIPLTKGIVLICNEEGRIHDLPANRLVRLNGKPVGLMMYGDFFVCRERYAKFVGLSEVEAGHWAALLSNHM
jgi:hypothetical protein